MLVLSRETHESIQFGTQVHIRVLALAGNRVKLGLEAPNGVRIVRTELLPLATSGLDSHPPSASTPAGCQDEPT